MNNYVKPVVLANEELAEGVYASSGSSSSMDGNCYTTTAYIHQKPEPGREDYRIQVNGVHAAGDNHHSTEQILTLTFNQAVTYVSSNGRCIGGDGTNEIYIQYEYHNNAYDNIGLGDVVVKSGDGLGDPVASLSCNFVCEQH